MYHRMGKRKLGRTGSHRIALMRNQTTSLLMHGHIVTTLAKAKELRSFIEPLITKAKVNNLANKRKVNQKLNDWEAVAFLFDEVAPRYVSRPGGYTRIIRYPDRSRDSAPIARIELVQE